MAGLTPCQFSSNKMQNARSILGLGDPNNDSTITGGNSIIGDTASTMTSWYEMWINPEKVIIKRPYQQKATHTAGAIVTYHYRPDTLKLSVTGCVGWIAINPQEEKTNLVATFLGSSTTNISQNSPRVFLSRLRNIADEPMYFIGLDGVEHYNTKFIKIYTKQYPNGVVCEGYFTSFNIPEDGNDVQTVNYDFEFTIESLKPMSFFQKMAGMWGK